MESRKSGQNKEFLGFLYFALASVESARGRKEILGRERRLPQKENRGFFFSLSCLLFSKVVGKSESQMPHLHSLPDITSGSLLVTSPLSEGTRLWEHPVPDSSRPRSTRGWTTRGRRRRRRRPHPRRRRCSRPCSSISRFFTGQEEIHPMLLVQFVWCVHFCRTGDFQTEEM